MFAAMMIAPTRWINLGPFRILQQPLPGNPAWATHWIYLAGKLIGKLLSVPSLTDCEWLARQADQPITLEWAEDGTRKRARRRGVAARKTRKA